MFQNLESILLSLIHTLPLEAFVFIASFVEEVFAPIPSMAVLLLTGTFASIQDRLVIDLIPLAIIAAAGKTIGAVFVYYIAKRIGEVIITKFGNFFDISKSSLESFSNKITGTPRDYLILILFRALPIVPSSVVSVGCGLINIKPRLYIVSTLIGTILRDSFFLYVGFKGTQILSTLANQSGNIESLMQKILIVFFIFALLYLYLKHKRNAV